VSFQNNQIVNLPEDMAILAKLEVIDLTGNPLDVKKIKREGSWR